MYRGMTGTTVHRVFVRARTSRSFHDATSSFAASDSMRFVFVPLSLLMQSTAYEKGRLRTGSVCVERDVQSACSLVHSVFVHSVNVSVD